MSEQPQYEKDEQVSHASEKEQDKRMDEKWQRDPLGAIIWAAILIWAGLVFLGSNLGWLAPLEALGFREAWSLVFAGAGVIILIGVLIRLVIPTYRRGVVGGIIWGLIFLGIGLGQSLGWAIIWPIILIVIGVAFLLGGIIRRR